MIQGAGSDEAWVGHDYRGWDLMKHRQVGVSMKRDRGLGHDYWFFFFKIVSHQCLCLWQFFDVKFIYTSHIRFVFTRYQNLASKEKLPL